MTMRAGIFGRDQDAVNFDSACSAMEHLLSRHPSDKATCYRDDSFFFAKVHIGAYVAPAFHADADGNVTSLIGEALLRWSNDVSGRSRNEDLTELHSGLTRGDWSLLSKARGAWCILCGALSAKNS